MPLGFMAEDSWQMAATGPLTRVAEARWQRGRQCLGGLGASQSLGYSLLPRIIFNSKSLIDVPSLFAFFFFLLPSSNSVVNVCSADLYILQWIRLPFLLKHISNSDLADVQKYKSFLPKYPIPRPTSPKFSESCLTTKFFLGTSTFS